MKIAVPSQGKQRNASIASSFARAPYVLVLDTGGKLLTVCHNDDLQETLHLAGTQVAGSLISLGVQAVITAKIGPKAFDTLRSAGVQVFEAPSGTVAGAIDSFSAGELTELPGANTEGHGPRS